MINQFSNANPMITPLKQNERYICSCCSMAFLEKHESHFDSGALLYDGNKAKVYCPICTSCYLRFYPSQFTKEQISPYKAYSLVTVIDQRIFNYKGYLKAAITTSMLDSQIQPQESISINGSKNKTVTKEMIENLKLVKTDYLTLARLFEKTTFGDTAPSETNQVQLVFERHQQIGETLMNKIRLEGGSRNQIENIFLLPSPSQLNRYLSNGTFSVDEFLKFTGIGIGG